MRETPDTRRAARLRCRGPWRRLGLCLLGLLACAACGIKAPPRPPGPEPAASAPAGGEDGGDATSGR
ncbi:MAG TPA: hypothetical protein PK668_01360 [Myxococcota bacterium]|nr:hypothetical protein [Myxococcota bacterium]HRY96750.1 hypothetical protein [Myxococcota bacterium]HSA22310.1 hypothetical protein [Myxococcota bacterium]